MNVLPHNHQCIRTWALNPFTDPDNWNNMIGSTIYDDIYSLPIPQSVVCNMCYGSYSLITSFHFPNNSPVYNKQHDNIIASKLPPNYWPFMNGIWLSPIDYPLRWVNDLFLWAWSICWTKICNFMTLMWHRCNSLAVQVSRVTIHKTMNYTGLFG